MSLGPALGQHVPKRCFRNLSCDFGAVPLLPSLFPLIDWISDTLSQGHTHLQSLVKCLDHRNVVSDPSLFGILTS